MKPRLLLQVCLLTWCAVVLRVQPVAAQNSPPSVTSDAPVGLTNWYSQSLRKIHFDMHTPGNIPDIGKDFDPDRFARELKSAGFDAVGFFAKCGYGWSYYPTKIGMMHPGLNYDLFGKGVAAMKKQNLKVIAYYGLAAAPAIVAERHPEWRLVSDSPSALPRENGGGIFCLFTPFLEDYTLPQLEEVASNYDIDGLFLDNLPNLAATKCSCSVCLAARKAAGFENLKTADEQAYYQWQLKRVERRCALVFDTLYRTHPNLLVGINYMSASRHGISFTPPEHTGFLTADIVNPGDVFLYSDYELAGWTWRNIPADCMQMRMLTNWKDWTVRSLGSRRSEAALALARGSTYFIGDLLLPQSLTLDPEIMSLHRQANDFLKERESLLGARSSAEVAVLHDSWVCNSEPKKQEYGLAAFTALMDDGQTAHVLRDHDLTKYLSNYRTLVISHCPALDEQAVAALERFVEGGGSLIFSGPVPAKNGAAFSKLLGVSFQGIHKSDTSYLFVTNLPFSAALRSKMHALPPVVCQSPVRCAMPDGAQMLCPLTSSGFISERGLRPPDTVTDHVGISLNHFGRGQAMYCSLPLAQEYWQRGNLEAKYLLQVMTRYLQPAPMVEVESDAALNLFTTVRKSELLVHLISRAAESRPEVPRIEISPPAIHDIELKLRLASPPEYIVLMPGNVPLAWKTEKDFYRVKLPPLKTHACCVIRLGASPMVKSGR